MRDRNVWRSIASYVMKGNDHICPAECWPIIERLAAYLDAPGADRAALDAIISHMNKCPYCESGVGRLIRALAVGEGDQLTCQECQELLPAYIQAEMDGYAHEEQWRPVVLHLEACSHCSEVYAALTDLMRLAYGDTGVEPPHYPSPALPFLQAGENAPRPPDVNWRLDEWGRLIIRFSAELMRTLQSTAYRPAYAVAGLKSAEGQRILCQLSLKEAVEDLEVTITVEEARDAPTNCTIIVTVNIPSRGGWPNLAGTRVTLKRGEEELETQWTDAFGKAVFGSISTDDLQHLMFEITSLQGRDTQQG